MNGRYIMWATASGRGCSTSEREARSETTKTKAHPPSSMKGKKRNRAIRPTYTCYYTHKINHQTHFTIIITPSDRSTNCRPRRRTANNFSLIISDRPDICLVTTGRRLSNRQKDNKEPSSGFHVPILPFQPTDGKFHLCSNGPLAAPRRNSWTAD
jgi:hypothetical protein